MARAANAITLEKRGDSRTPGPPNWLDDFEGIRAAVAWPDQVPVVWDHGEGVWVWDVDGNRFLDFTSGVLVTQSGGTPTRATWRAYGNRPGA